MKIFEFNGRQLIDQISGLSIINSGVEFKRTDKGISAYITSGNSLSVSGIDIDVVDMVSWIGGVGTARVTVGSTNTDIIANGWVNTKTVLSLTDQTNINITCLSGYVFVRKVELYSNSLSTYLENKIQENFLHTYPLAKSKKIIDLETLELKSFSDSFEYEKADGTIIVPLDWIKGTGDYKILTTNRANETNLVPFRTNYLECVNPGTISFHAKLDDLSDNGYFKSLCYYNGSTWSQVGEDTVDNVVSSNSWLSLSDNILTFDLASGTRIANIKITS